MVFVILERMKITSMKEHYTVIESIQYQVKLNTKYQDDDYRCLIRAIQNLTRKTGIVHHKVYHLYSLKKMIVLKDIDDFNLVDLETRLSVTLPSQS